MTNHNDNIKFLQNLTNVFFELFKEGESDVIESFDEFDNENEIFMRELMKKVEVLLGKKNMLKKFKLLQSEHGLEGNQWLNRILTTGEMEQLKFEFVILKKLLRERIKYKISQN